MHVPSPLRYTIGDSLTMLAPLVLPIPFASILTRLFRQLLTKFRRSYTKSQYLYGSLRISIVMPMCTNLRFLHYRCFLLFLYLPSLLSFFPVSGFTFVSFRTTSELVPFRCCLSDWLCPFLEFVVSTLLSFPSNQDPRPCLVSSHRIESNSLLFSSLFLSHTSLFRFFFRPRQSGNRTHTNDFGDRGSTIKLFAQTSFSFIHLICLKSSTSNNLARSWLLPRLA
jgi:hypothetical protein